MAGQNRESSFTLKADLLGRSHEFSFFQVIRLLRIFGGGIERYEDAGGIEKNIRIRPDLSLSFPASDIASIEEADDTGRFLVTTTFLGLYGSSSPLPTFYTEDLMDEARDDMTVTRDFIDIINHRLFLMLFHCWTKYRQFIQVIEEQNPSDLERLFCLIGLGEKEFREPVSETYPLIRYAGLLTQFPRSALGLETLLKDVLTGTAVEVIPCIRRKVKISQDQRLFLGTAQCALGESTILGEEIDDRMGKFRIQIGPLSSVRFQELLPGTPAYRRMHFLTQFYISEPLEFDFALILGEREAKTACLGSPQWSRLGWDTWTFSSDQINEVKVSFPSYQNEETSI
jgi:type VI secretion system protein ImpH